ncbi:zinc finger BED domain-containing protein 5-like [Palaemon carinicauda]|uniref:zinc finger BED domain-containing protein 5-like n=1 Tax=Palaemon carinicauda TaxID=392227 RepID=UPI0035B68DF0
MYKRWFPCNNRLLVWLPNKGERSQPQDKQNALEYSRYALAVKTLPADLKPVLNDAVAMVNLIKNIPLNTRLLHLLYEELNAEEKPLLFHIEVRWLSRVNIVTRGVTLNGEPSFQGYSATVIDFVDKVRAFEMKIKLWQEKVTVGWYDSFENMSDSLSVLCKYDVNKVSGLIHKHLVSLS